MCRMHTVLSRAYRHAARPELVLRSPPRAVTSPYAPSTPGAGDVPHQLDPAYETSNRLALSARPSAYTGVFRCEVGITST